MDNPTATARVVGANIRALRRDREWTLAELASRLGEVGLEMSVSALSKKERVGLPAERRVKGAKNKVPTSSQSISVDELVAFAKAFGVSTDRLLSDNGAEMTMAALNGWLAQAHDREGNRALEEMHRRLADEAELAMGTAVTAMVNYAEAEGVDLAELIERNIDPHYAHTLTQAIREAAR